MSKVVVVPIDSIHPDPNNPRKNDQARMSLLRLSLAKLGFIQPIFTTEDGLILSGHQRTDAAKSLGIKNVPVVRVSVTEKLQNGINVLFNRATNDFNAFDTGTKARDKLSLDDVIAAAEDLDDYEGENWLASKCRELPIKGVGASDADKYDKKATVLADSVMKMGIRIPIVVSESGQVVNGIHRLHAAKEAGERTWPTIVVPDDIASVALNFLNYLSMDFHVDDEFARLLRYSAYRRPQNNRGLVPKAYRFWANGNKTLLDKDSYSTEYWVKFRDLHGQEILDFGAGLCKVKPFLETKGMRCSEFEPYRIDPDSEAKVPSPEYSRMKAKEFLDEIADGRKFTSIFLASVMNSIPFAKDRLMVLAIINALCSKDTVVYGTCRDMSDFNYEYGGIRNANYFVFDSEPGVRIGDVARNPKIQKFETPETADAMFSRFWVTRDYDPGGNVFYYRLADPKGVNYQALAQSLQFEFGDIPYSDGSTMGLGDYAKKCFAKRLGLKKL